MCNTYYQIDLFKSNIKIIINFNNVGRVKYNDNKIFISDLVPEKEIDKMVMSSRIFLLIIFLTISLSFYFNSFLPILLIITPQIYGGPVLWLLAFTQHAGLKFDSFDHRETTRTVILGPVLGTFLYSNMQYHIEHHACPQVPFYNLPEFHSLIKDQLPKSNKGLIDAYREIIPAIIKQSKDPSYEIAKQFPV